MRVRSSWLAGLACAVGAGVSAGCLAAAAAGAGGGIYFSGHNAEAIVDRPVSAMVARAEAVLRAENVAITESSTQESGDKREMKGTQGDLDITVSVEREEGGATKVRVSARKNLVSWDDDYARELLAKIIA